MSRKLSTLPYPTLRRPTQASALAPTRPNSAQEYSQCMHFHKYLKSLERSPAAIELAPSIIRILWRIEHCDKYHNRAPIRNKIKKELNGALIDRILAFGDNPVDVCMAENVVSTLERL